MVAKLIELIEARHRDLELERCAAQSTGERNQEPSLQALLPGRLDLVADEADRGLPVYRQNVIGEACEIQRDLHRSGGRATRPRAVRALAPVG